MSKIAARGSSRKLWSGSAGKPPSLRWKWIADLAAHDEEQVLAPVAVEVLDEDVGDLPVRLDLVTVRGCIGRRERARPRRNDERGAQHRETERARHDAETRDEPARREASVARGHRLTSRIRTLARSGSSTAGFERMRPSPLPSL